MLFTGWEGIICGAMSLPLVAIGVAVGAAIGYKVRGRFIDQMAAPGKTTIVLLLLGVPWSVGALPRSTSSCCLICRDGHRPCESA